MRWMAAICGVLAAFAAPASAQDDGAQDGGEDMICLTFARGWWGSAEELRRIRKEPAPQSYRDVFESGGCERFQLIVSSLMSWHFAMGDETTATGAASYLEEHSLRQPLAASEVEPQLRRAWDAAWPAIEQHARLIAANDFDAANTLRRDNRNFVALDRLFGRIGSHAFVADTWLDGARFYASPAMTRRASPHMAVLEAFERFMVSVEPQNATLGSARIEGIWDWDFDRRWVFRRHASLRAALLGEIDALPPVSNERPTDAQYELEEYLQEGGMIQEIESREEDFETLFAEVDANPNWAREQILIWREEAFSDLARDSRPGTASMAGRPCDTQKLYHVMQGLAALEFDGHGAHEIMGYRRISLGPSERDDRIALLLAESDCLYAATERAVQASDPEGAHGSLGRSLDALAIARQLVQPDESPGRFRQIAERYLSRLERCRTLVAWSTQGLHTCAGSQDTGLQAYFETNLAALPAIMVGAERISD